MGWAACSRARRTDVVLRPKLAVTVHGAVLFGKRAHHLLVAEVDVAASAHVIAPATRQHMMNGLDMDSVFSVPTPVRNAAALVTPDEAALRIPKSCLPVVAVVTSDIGTVLVAWPVNRRVDAD